MRSLERAHPRILIDGRSGSGKTTLADRLRTDWPAGGVPCVVAMDEFYPGWDGLAAGSEIAADRILDPLSRGECGAYRRWNWEADVPGERVSVDPERPLIVEGAGALTPGTRRLSDLAIWVEAPEPGRRARALARDGAAYVPHWERWAAQERAHIAAHGPRELADLVVALP